MGEILLSAGHIFWLQVSTNEVDKNFNYLIFLLQSNGINDMVARQQSISRNYQSTKTSVLFRKT